jgi:hypothetical protein
MAVPGNFGTSGPLTGTSALTAVALIGPAPEHIRSRDLDEMQAPRGIAAGDLLLIQPNVG